MPILQLVAQEEPDVAAASVPEHLRAAANEYRRVHREANPDFAERDRLQKNARDAALRRLSELHGDLFRALVNEEREHRGLPPLGTRGPRKAVVEVEGAEYR
jgi:hypothetical protein